jgi:cysteine desulfurase / selenocysteine lyase
MVKKGGCSKSHLLASAPEQYDLGRLQELDHPTSVWEVLVISTMLLDGEIQQQTPLEVENPTSTTIQRASHALNSLCSSVKSKVGNVMLISTHREVWTSIGKVAEEKRKHRMSNNRLPLADPRELVLPLGTWSFLAWALAGRPTHTSLKAREQFLVLGSCGTEIFPHTTPLEKKARESFAQLVGCDPKEIAFTYNAGYGLLTAAQCMMPEINSGDNIVTPGTVYASVALAAEPLKQQRGAEIRLCEASTEGIIAAINLWQPKAVFVEGCNYPTGEKYDVEEIAAAAHEVGARIVLDASQTAGVEALSFTSLDMIVFTAGKRLGAVSNELAVIAWNSRRWPNIPGIPGWRSVEPITLPYTGEHEFLPTARRLEPGGIPWAALAGTVGVDDIDGPLQTVLDLGQARITQHVSELNGEIIEGIIGLDMGLHILTPRNPSKRAGYISVRMTDVKAREVCSRLNAQGVYLSFGQGRLRLSPWIYNGSEDVALSIEHLGMVLRDMRYTPGDPAWEGVAK